MPDMRDAIAQYLAFQGNRGGQALPLQAYQQLPSGQYLPDMLSDTYIPPWAQTPPSPDYTGPQPTQMPPGPPMPRPGTPDADFTGMPVTPPSPYPFPSQGMPDDTSGLTPPVNTPMQAPPLDAGRGQPAPEMDPSVWERMYGSGR